MDTDTSKRKSECGSAADRGYDNTICGIACYVENGNGGAADHQYVENGNVSEREYPVVPIPHLWTRIICNGEESERPRQQAVWPTRDAVRVNFRNNKFSLPPDVQLAASCDSRYGDFLEFHLIGESRRDPLGLLQSLRARYSIPHSRLFNEKLQFDIADDRLYVTMPSGIGSDLVAELVTPQLRHCQARVKARLPNRPVLIMSGSSGLIQVDGAPICLCGDGSIVDRGELRQKTLEAHALKKAGPRNLKVFVNFEALSYSDDKDSLIRKCKDQVRTGQALVSVALCDREGDGEVLTFRKSGTVILIDRCINPRFIDLSDVIPSFRVYLSYGTHMYFQAHHQHDMKDLSVPDLLRLLCDSIEQEDTELAKEAINGLPSVDILDEFGRSAMVCAALKGDHEMVEYLIDNGAKVDFTDGSGVLPALAARAEDHDSVADFLERQGGGIDLSVDALVDAVTKSQVKRLDFLLKAGVHSDEVDAQGMTALMHACCVGNEDAVRRLLSAGASKGLRDNYGCTARDCAWKTTVINALDNI